MRLFNKFSVPDYSRVSRKRAAKCTDEFNGVSTSISNSWFATYALRDQKCRRAPSIEQRFLNREQKQQRTFYMILLLLATQPTAFVCARDTRAVRGDRTLTLPSLAAEKSLQTKIVKCSGFRVDEHRHVTGRNILLRWQSTAPITETIQQLDRRC